MGQAIGGSLPLAIGIALSPIPIIAVVLMLTTARARANGLAFLVGWLVGLGIVGAVVLAIAGPAGASESGAPATWVSWVKIALGALLLLVALRQFPRSGGEAPMPRWMARIDNFKPPAALGLAAVLSIDKITNEAWTRPMKLLAAARLSRTTGTSTSIETQTAGVEAYVKAYGHEVVHWTQDLDVSGGVPIRERPDVGPWLQDDHLGEWDGIIGYKLDRLFRSQGDYVDFYRDFCLAHGKVIISASEGIDTSTEVGKFVGDLLTSFAEMERGRMRARRRDVAKRIRESGRWGGGQVPAFYKAKKVPGGWTLVPDPALAGIVSRVVDKIIAGASLTAVSGWLNKEGIPSPRETARKKGTPYRWWPATVRDVFRNRSLLGEQVHDGRVVHGPDGLPVKFPPILDGPRWDRLQASLDALSLPQGAGRRNAAPLTHIAYCTCEAPLWATSAHGYSYYQCASRSRGHRCGLPLIRADLLEPVTDEALLEVLGPVEIVEKIIVKGDDHRTAMTEAGRAIRDLVDERYVRGVVRADHDEMLASLQAEHKRLSELRPQPAQVIERPTGVFIRDVLPTLDATGKRSFLLKRGVRVFAAMARYPDWGPHAIREKRLVVMYRRGLLVMVYTGEPGDDVNDALGGEIRALCGSTDGIVLQQHPVILGLSAAAVVADLGAGLVTPPPP